MSFRVGGVLALVAAALLAFSLATSAWWSGHPATDGHERAMQTVSIGLSGGEGCNTGGEGSCKKILLGGTFKTMSGLVLIVGGLTVLVGLALALTAQLRRTERVPLARTALGAGAVLAVLALVLIVMGPDMIKAPSGTSVPLGIGALAGLVGALVMVAGGLLGGRPAVARAAGFGPHAVAAPPEQLHFAPPATDFPVAPWMAPAPPPPPAPWLALPQVSPPPPPAAPSARPPLAKLGPTHEGALPVAATEAIVRPPTAPASSPSSQSSLRPPPPSGGWTLPRSPEPLAGPRGPLSPRTAPPPPPAFVTSPPGPRPVIRPPTAPPPVPSPVATLRKPPASLAPPTRAPNLPAPRAPAPPRPSTAPPPFGARPAPPLLQTPTPTRVRATAPPFADDESTTAVDDAVDPLGETQLSAPNEPGDHAEVGDRTEATVRALPEDGPDPTGESFAPRLEAAFAGGAPFDRADTPHAGSTAGGRPGSSHDVLTAANEPALRPSMTNATTPFPRLSEQIVASSPRPRSRAELSDMSELAALTERPASPTAAQTVVEAPEPDSVPSTGPASPIGTADLAPPDDLAPASAALPASDVPAPASGPSPACPQCDAPMAWVEEHLRFYCKSCKMYF